MDAAFSEDGLLAQGSSQFEYRAQQQRMAGMVGYALDHQRPLVVEAATGVGKSLAYLVPAITHALEAERKAIVCTHTINLQEQLIGKDVPIVKKLVGDFNAEILKGRSNYLCPTRLARAYKETPDLFTSTEQADLKLLADWSTRTKDGTLSDLDFTPSQRIWSQVCSEPHACTPRRCGPGSGCWYQAARRRLAEADLVILNHTLFFTLLNSAEDVLPDDANFLFPRDFVIVDEAHTIENIAARAFGIHVSESSLKFELGRLFNPRTRKGFFPFVGEERGVREVEQALGEIEAFFRNVESVCHFNGPAREYRIREPELVENTLALPLKRIEDIAMKAGDAARSDNTRADLHDAARRIMSLRGGIAAFLDQQEDGHVYWAEKNQNADRGTAPTLALHSAPIDVSEKLGEIFFTGGKAAIFTSATLGVTDDEDMQYFRKRVGAMRSDAAAIDSPFDYRKQMRLYLAKTMPEPTHKDYQATLARWIIHFLDLSKGRAFVLFTSYGSMKAMAEAIEDHCEDRGWQLLVQGRGMPRHRMLAEFKKDTHSVLFGTDSFWTGVDVPGESLSNVIITRLPFAVPDHPVTAARLEHIQASGGNPFTEYSVPEAILKLRQGVGRLIRSTKDRGICCILDNRILSKPYGRAFLAAMPDCPVEIVNHVPEP
ncbi:MAG: DEAD/DEAH box helicase [Verrucomicrobiaceae bacterium]|nr:DEAD/DEAH box helicase [Verrucomicrobiaceae bacterium]